MLLCAASTGSASGEVSERDECAVVTGVEKLLLTWGWVQSARGEQEPSLCTHIGDTPRPPTMWGKETATGTEPPGMASRRILERREGMRKKKQQL